MAKARLDIENMLVPKGADVARHLTLPTKGQSQEWILHEMDQMDKELTTQTNWRLGKLSGAVYRTSFCPTFYPFLMARSISDGGDDLETVIVSAYQRYCVSNPLHPDVFPAIRKMEAEIVAMCLRLYNNPDGAGTMTSGGTESIIMAVKTHRDWARAVKGITEPEMSVFLLTAYLLRLLIITLYLIRIVPSSAHVAFLKAASYLKIKVHNIPVDHHTRKVCIKRVKRAMSGPSYGLMSYARLIYIQCRNPNTIMVIIHRSGVFRSPAPLTSTTSARRVRYQFP